MVRRVYIPSEDRRPAQQPSPASTRRRIHESTLAGDEQLEFDHNGDQPKHQGMGRTPQHEDLPGFNRATYSRADDNDPVLPFEYAQFAESMEYDNTQRNLRDASARTNRRAEPRAARAAKIEYQASPEAREQKLEIARRKLERKREARANRTIDRDLEIFVSAYDEQRQAFVAAVVDEVLKASDALDIPRRDMSSWLSSEFALAARYFAENPGIQDQKLYFADQLEKFFSRLLHTIEQTAERDTQRQSHEILNAVTQAATEIRDLVGAYGLEEEVAFPNAA